MLAKAVRRPIPGATTIGITLTEEPKRL